MATNLKKIYWYIIVFIFMVEFTIKVSPGFLRPYLQHDFNLTYTQAGLYSSIFYITYALAQLPAGYMIQYYGIKRNFLFLLLIFILGLCGSASATTFSQLCLARFLMGLGSAVTFTTLLTLALRWFEEKNYSFYVGMTNLFGMLGPIFLSMSFSYFNVSESWQSFYTYLALIMTFLFMALCSMPLGMTPQKEEESNKLDDFKEILSNSYFWISLTIATTMVIPIALIPELWGTFFLETYHQIPSQSVPLLNSLVFCGIAVGGPLIGYFATFLPLSTLLSYGLRFQALSLVLLPVSSEKVFLPLFFVGFWASTMLLFFTLIKDKFPSVPALSIALFNMMLTVLSTLTQPLIGIFLDKNIFASAEVQLIFVFFVLATLNIILDFSFLRKNSPYNLFSAHKRLSS